MRILLALFVCTLISFSSEAKVIKANTLAEAIIESNLISGKDSLYLSDFNVNSLGEKAQYDITDQLVLINDLGDKADLLNEAAVFKVAIVGSLQLVGFDIAQSKATIINLGKVSLSDCSFTEGKDLTQYFKNKGLFIIKNGVFKGSEDGVIIRDAHFKVGAPIVL